jgi:hypothetical protein
MIFKFGYINYICDFQLDEFLKYAKTILSLEVSSLKAGSVGKLMHYYQH